MQKEKPTTDEREPMLPLDERFRQAEQYSFDFPKAQQPRAPAFVCIGYCAACPRCRN